MLVIVNVETGEKVRAVRGGVARWADGAVTHAARAGLRRGAEKVVSCLDAVSGEGAAERVVGEAFDGEAWVVARERYAPVESPEQLRARFTAAIQERLDAFARTRLYDGIQSACTYAASDNPAFAAEGRRCLALRDETWAAAYALLDAVLAGARPAPTLDEMWAELPALTWPEDAAAEPAGLLARARAALSRLFGI
ncbi:MAG: hypothetical protein IH626_18200 [Rhodospirillales bacterium]|nr:hypothetical protein [Rhodospirillales bacterium]